MNDWLGYIQDELQKQFAKRQLKLLMGLALLIGIGSSWIKYNLLQQSNSAFLQSSILPLTTLQLISGFILPLFIFALGSELIISEFGDGTIKNLFSLPLSRAQLFFGKLAAGMCSIALILACVLVPTIIADLLMQGLPSLSQVGSLVIGTIGIFLFGGMILTLANTIAIWTKSAGNGMLIGVAAWIGMGPAAMFIQGIQRYLPNQLDHWYMPLIQGGDLLRVISPLCFMISYTVIFTVLGFYKFNTKEV